MRSLALVSMVRRFSHNCQVCSMQYYRLNLKITHCCSSTSTRTQNIHPCPSAKMIPSIAQCSYAVIAVMSIYYHSLKYFSLLYALYIYGLDSTCTLHIVYGSAVLNKTEKPPYPN